MRNAKLGNHLTKADVNYYISFSSRDYSSKQEIWQNLLVSLEMAGEQNPIPIEIGENRRKPRIEIMKPKCFFFHGQHG